MPKKVHKEYINYVCLNCLKSFGNRKDYYEKHLNNKKPCKKIIPEEVIQTPPQIIQTNLINEEIKQNNNIMK
jgi:hypothetical protein